MVRIQKLSRLCAAAAGLLLVGCAPSFGPGIGIGLTSGPRLSFSVSQCSLLGGPTPEAARMGIPTAASAQGFAVVDRISAIQARYSLGSRSVRGNPESWKRIAAGGC